ncbi:MAG: hypothetical protein IPF92_16745 [Myxococcales bacterium]|jgi:hypothetical protein|nr:hypothetical protein [Myxococcales bacterium]MBL0195450.1 hypothetical protein [Myxococcales bacterium]HQY60142.1 hypothetical protein [Polyangiaceae bacterium]
MEKSPTSPGRPTGTLVAALLLACACTGGGGLAPDADAPDADACVRPLELSWGRREGAGFTPFRDGDPGKITLGFQGFRFIDGVARLGGTQAKAASFRLQVTVDGHRPSTQDVGRIDLVAGPDGALYAEPLQLFFNDTPLPELLGRNAAVVLRASTPAAGGSGACSAQQSMKLALERGGCQAADGGTECPDAGP